MIRRFAFIALAIAAAASAQTRVRIVAGNLTSGNAQSYDAGHGTRIFQALKPDIALIQEWNTGDNSPAALRQWVTGTFGAQYQFHREASRPGEIPNGIVSRFPILDKGEWDDTMVGNREFVWARIDVPGDRDLYAVSVHLLTDDSRRPAQAQQLASILRQRVPAAALLTVGGDFNTDSARDGALQALRGLVTVPAQLPSDGTGRTGTNRNRTKPYDHVLADSDLEPLRTSVTVAGRTFPNGLVFDSRVFEPLSGVAPVRRDDSAAVNMQHMAVVRDFLIPGAAPVQDPPSGAARESGRPRDTHENLHSTLWQQTAVEYRGLCLQAFRIARMQLDKALADRSWTAALEQTGDFTQLPLAIISDVDETLVDNSPAQARAIRRNLGYFDRTLWNEWVNERGSSALPGAVEFARYAASRGVTIFYVTNRTHEEEPATRDNLTRLGFEVKNLSGLGPELEDTLLTRGPSPEKRERRAAVARHYRILLLLGDDLGDFLPEIRTTVGGRAAKSLPHEKMWGDRWIVLPNPSYGSWEGAVTGSRPGLADEETLRRKREALRDR